MFDTLFSILLYIYVIFFKTIFKKQLKLNDYNIHSKKKPYFISLRTEFYFLFLFFQIVKQVFLLFLFFKTEK